MNLTPGVIPPRSKGGDVFYQKRGREDGTEPNSNTEKERGERHLLVIARESHIPTKGGEGAVTYSTHPAKRGKKTKPPPPSLAEPRGKKEENPTMPIQASDNQGTTFNPHKKKEGKRQIKSKRRHESILRQRKARATALSVEEANSLTAGIAGEKKKKKLLYHQRFKASS